MRRIVFPAWTTPLFLLIVCLISFGTLASKLGFYWDDWAIAYYIHFFGPSSFRAAFSVDRPLMAWFYFFTTRLLGVSIIKWQIFAIVSRWFACVALWWMLRGLWLGKTLRVAAICLLFSVYPGFRQQYIAITYGNAFLIYAIFLVSLGAMVWAVRESQDHPGVNWFWPLFLFSIVTSFSIMFTLEYFFGLELLRPVLLWMLLSRTISGFRKRLGSVALYWLPYLLSMVSFLAWRVINETPRAKIIIFENLRANPFVTFLEIGKTILLDLFEVTALAWKQTYYFSQVTEYEPVVTIKFLLVVLGVAVITLIYLLKLQDGILEKQKRQVLWSVLLGLFALLIAGIPIWMTNLKISLSFPWDRFTLPMMVGASILLVSLIEILPIRHWQTTLIIGLAIGIAAGFHFQNALSYRKAWLLQRDLFWQLTWRIPALQPNTVILTTELSIPYNRDDSLTSPFNWIYAPENSSSRIPYILYNVETRLSEGLPEMDDNLIVESEYRLSYYKGPISKSVFILFKPPNCVKNIDPLIDMHYPDKPRYFRKLLPFPVPSRIIPEGNPPARPPSIIFGSEPPHEWCYYFEKAELASQLGDWRLVAMLADEALRPNKKFSKDKVIELAPFIEGYARTGEYEKASQLTMQTFRTRENSRYFLCDIWDRVDRANHLDPEGKKAYQDMQEFLKCKAP